MNKDKEKNLRNWEEDFNHENGNYINKCKFCKNDFIGHKRRVICKTCSKLLVEVAIEHLNNK